MADSTSSPTAEKQVPKIPTFWPGDTVKIFYKVKEEGKERIQPFEGVIIAQKGAGISKTITVRKIASLRIGVERIFPLLSPNIEKIEITKHGKVRRSKLYFLRQQKTRLA
ncbi:50S ribosomal protein L19 [candidate division WWE3 bacterium RIFCSPLOWO2_02_FULL_53_10]|uniref:50S ribosomal protein L19 n=2 Tax=Katanobacteria TaxID=422282 RepID=A0A1F4W4B1_UNCKA|nr:MAG: 50S ribosomal protein L19 [candidate division WWE3 bacterium RIFCSPLOWO2_01_FULL_53_14]OGC64226.1 MAG: 50S ribosomal protein L19 [candidate division WWE3 bacterium RIFCSPLOWO2_02_FULL_53_10]